MIDQAQLARIEAVHRGFLFQHLYAAQCLLTARDMKAVSVAVETDEDVEIQLESVRHYVQIKHRQTALAWSDVESALTRFGELQKAHTSGRRPGSAKFVIVSNAAPNGPLRKKMELSSWPDDVTIDWPQAEISDRQLPLPQDSLLSAVQMCCSLAGDLPFATLAPETLVWKLAGLVTLAATGERQSLDHVFEASELPALFEQLVAQLQDLPAPPTPYRAQTDEPDLTSDERVRLILGHSGAGKTSWLAQIAQHAPGTMVYLDVADIPGAGLANAVARELAARLYTNQQELGAIVLRGASGHEMLQAIAAKIGRSNVQVTVALDNVHKSVADDLLGVVKSAASARFILLGRPEGETSAIEAILGTTREELKGWSADTIADAAHANNCRVDAADCQRLIDLTGALPLFVLNALSVTTAGYGGSVKRFCQDLAQLAHSKETAQEVILGRVFDGLPQTAASAADLLSLCDAPISRDEVAIYGEKAGGLEKPALLAGLRALRTRGLLQVFSNDRVKLHDAARVIGKGRLALLDGAELKRKKEVLRGIALISLLNRRTRAMLSLFLKLSGEVGRLDILVEMAGDEIFHEMGVWQEVEHFLEQGASDESVPVSQRVKALDGLAFAALKADSGRASNWLDQMEALIQQHGLDSEERLRVGMKRMTELARERDGPGVARLVAELEPIVVALSPAHRRIFHYNVAASELLLGDAAAAADRVRPLVEEYYGLVGLTPERVMGNNAPELATKLGSNINFDDIKHLADSLDLLAKAMDKMGASAPFARIHALKFYELASAPHSLLRVGQDLVDQFIRHRDFDGALQIMESILLPQLQQWKLADFMIPIRSHYAVVLAYCRQFERADVEIARLQPYIPGLSAVLKKELSDQTNLILELKRSEPIPKFTMPAGLQAALVRRLGGAASVSGRPTVDKRKKVGRNDPCPCGSGKKFKVCHG